MTAIKKIPIYLVILSMVISLLPYQVLATVTEEITKDTEGVTATIFTEEESGTVNLYKENNQESEILTQLQNNTEVTVINEDDESFFLVEYSIPEKSEIWKGYIEKSNIKLPAQEMQDDEIQKENPQVEKPQVKEPNVDQLPSEEEMVEEEVPSNQEEDKPIAEEQQTVEQNPVVEEEQPEEQQTSNNQSKLAVAASSAVYEGVTLNATKVYSTPSTSANVLRTYSKGTVLKFYIHSTEWYWSNITVNGKLTKIYINKKDIEQATDNPVRGEGVALKTSTNMYASPTTDGKVLRTYASGTILKFYTYTSGWYKSNITVNGKLTTIYINKNDIELPTSNPVRGEGVAVKNPTNVYASPSTGGKVLRTYPAGTVLKYYTYTTGWYRSNITIKGNLTTIYIKKSDIEQPVANPTKGEGIALKEPTNVYSAPSRDANVLRRYSSGTILKYYDYTTNWYKSTITVNGKATTIYINKADIEQADRQSAVLQGIAKTSPTNVYQLPSTNSKVLRKYNKGTILKYYDYSPNWYVTGITVNGKYQDIYIRKVDVSAEQLSQYSITLDQAVAMQMRLTDPPPQTDTTGVLSKYTNFITSIERASDPGFFDATAEQVRYYMDPKNFSAASTSFYQFLVLSSPAGTNATEVNNTILKGRGVLAGKASSFIQAAKTHNINEVYLISHSLLETGNGTSPLATGIKYNGVTVYNVYGIGAFDGDANNKGAEYAYNQGWTTIEKAIVGGAAFVSKNYIHAGQNTLYKMRWNPDGMIKYGYATHQYASDVGWAVKQTRKIAEMYASLTQYNLLYDVPVYR
ncbi:glucosaminidase domain-containing protein [Bacillus sp. FJAT-27986]|uniref:glucosaminidase domain-containing protein n=1 Tax=Bacillus sp. FJAT-27986 TaxID=1743146 RepID=UPI00080ADEF9|nr:glucosaminidase domain-containing protein [Bacillus sp. FJAT-27986]OCA84647.1 hypothetical protein A8L44_09605 [Bacillus sp. FJAT-27986]